MRRHEQELVESVLRAVAKSPVAMASLDAMAAKNAKRLLRRLSRELALPVEEKPGNQLKLYYSFMPRNKQRRRGAVKWARYPMSMVEDARAMRANEYTYKEIAAALKTAHKIEVPWITVRDWTQGHSRITK